MAEQNSGFMGAIDSLAGYYRDIKVAKESSDGKASPDVAPESIPDQTALGRTDQTGPNFNTTRPGEVVFAGVPFDTRILATTGLLIGGVLVMRKLR